MQTYVDDGQVYQNGHRHTEIMRATKRLLMISTQGDQNSSFLIIDMGVDLCPTLEGPNLSLPSNLPLPSLFPFPQSGTDWGSSGTSFLSFFSFPPLPSPSLFNGGPGYNPRNFLT